MQVSSLLQAADGATIFALATPPGRSSVAVVRVSGSDLAQCVFVGTVVSGLRKAICAPRCMVRSKVVVGNGQELDDALVVYFPAPKSFTGEDVLEIHLHGNRLIAERLQEELARIPGFRQALPGEFSWRAFKAGKLGPVDLEKLEWRLNAQSQSMLEYASRLNQQSVVKRLSQIGHAALAHRSRLELLGDFSEDVQEEQTWEELCSTWNIFQSELKSIFRYLHLSGSQGFIPKIALFGKTNAGKSTLFNKLLQFDRSIVSAQPGTTRDYVSQIVHFGGDTFELIDTAGFRGETAEDQVEAAGIALTESLLSESFFKIWVLDGRTAGDEWDFASSQGADVYLFSHNEMFHVEQLPNHLQNLPSFDNGTNFNELEFLLKTASTKLREHFSGDENLFLARRFREQLISLEKNGQTYGSLLNSSKDLAILDQQFRMIEEDIKSLSLDYSADDVMNHIFSNFCIGK